ncbi:MAG TPA: M23 family metallopeptidase [Xanthobacteraceae bacterium]|nr:M23 family metallopeptidase [Xanthobacteraceae bacterium]
MNHSPSGRRDFYYPHHEFQRPRPAARPRNGGWKIAALFAIPLLSLWAGATTLYLVYRDDALMFLAHRQTEMVQSYDAQLTTLETEIERLKSKKLVDQERVDRAVLDLSRRQALVEQRQKELSSVSPPKSNAMPGEDITGTIAPNGPPQPAPGVPPKPSPISDTIIFRPPPDRSAELESRPMAPSLTRLGFLDASNPAEVRIEELSRGLDRLQARQAEALNRIEESYEGMQSRVRKVLAEVGVSMPPPTLAERAAAIGGPLLPFLSGNNDPFEQQLSRVRASVSAVNGLSQLIDRVPVRRPVPPGAEVTSVFGPRLDPFIKQFAFHSGIDLKGEPGDAVRATAAGRVVTASYQGGYGLMVEVDHGNGLATRYGHLSIIEVSEGQVIEAGDTVGRIGTSGRSTGPHLHYEVRLAGEPIDPERYLRAGVRLTSAP